MVDEVSTGRIPVTQLSTQGERPHRASQWASLGGPMAPKSVWLRLLARSVGKTLASCLAPEPLWIPYPSLWIPYPYHTPERSANLPVLSPNPSAGTPSLSSRPMYKFVSGVPSG